MFWVAVICSLPHILKQFLEHGAEVVLKVVSIGGGGGYFVTWKTKHGYCEKFRNQRNKSGGKQKPKQKPTSLILTPIAIHFGVSFWSSFPSILCADFFWDSLSLCSHGTLCSCVDQASLTEISASAYWILGLKVCTITLGYCFGKQWTRLFCDILLT